MKICAYVQEKYAKTAYKNECLDSRQFVGLRVIIDAIERAGYNVEWAGKATVHKYDVVLVSLTSDCDWWTFIAERVRWQKGNYTVIIGGAGLLHITPFLPFGDYFVWGRGENIAPELVKAIDKGTDFHSESVGYGKTFSPDSIYKIATTDEPYPHKVQLAGDKSFGECAIGCNHKCMFCGYTWHRKFVSEKDYYQMTDELFGGIDGKELAMLDFIAGKSQIDFSKLRTTAIDGLSERLRVMVNKPISRKILKDFLVAMLESGAKPHRVKFYNIIGYPSETEDDWFEFLEDVATVDKNYSKQEKQWCIDLHSTPFRPMPATPMACAPAQKRNFRNVIGQTLGKGLRGGIVYQGNVLWVLDAGYTDSLSTHMLSMLAHRGTEKDTENIIRLCCTPKFWRAASNEKAATLERYFDVDELFRAYTPEELPSRYLRTYANVERLWGRQWT